MSLESFLIFLSLLFVAHWIGDFVLQTDRMALKKSHDNEILTKHVVVYTIPLVVWMMLIISCATPSQNFWWFYPANFAAHWAIDWCTSRLNARLYTNHRHYFFVSVGFDQLLHTLTLLATFYIFVHP